MIRKNECDALTSKSASRTDLPEDKHADDDGGDEELSRQEEEDFHDEP